MAGRPLVSHSGGESDTKSGSGCRDDDEARIPPACLEGEFFQPSHHRSSASVPSTHGSINLSELGRGPFIAMQHSRLTSDNRKEGRIFGRVVERRGDRIPPSVRGYHPFIPLPSQPLSPLPGYFKGRATHPDRP